MQFSKPNLSIPLASSYNERGVAGFTNTVTNALDQRKINSIYEPVKNALTGKMTLYLAKRPGVAIGGTYGTTGQVAYLVSNGANLFGNANGDMWVFSVDGNDVRASNNSGTTTVIVTAANYRPTYVDKTAISNTDTLIVQLFNSTSGAQTVWYSSAIATFTQITDSDFTGLTHAGKMEFMDGFAFVLDATTKAIYNSDLNSLANWTASSYITKQIKQDSAYGLMRLGSQILAFGAETGEVFVNAGNPSGSPLISVKDRAFRIGIEPQTVANGTTGLTHYYATLGGRIYFFGQQGGKRNRGIFSYDGSQFNKVSSLAVDKILGQQGVYSINTAAFHGKEAIFFALDLTTATTQRWLVYFPEWNDWFEWNSTVFTPVGNGSFNLGVGSNQHRLYFLGSFTDNWQDDGTNYTMTHQFKLPSNGNDLKRMPMCSVVGDVSRSASSLNVEFSDDDYQSWSTARAIDMTSATKMLSRCGAYRQRAVRLTHTANLDCRMERFLARIE